LYWNFCVVKEFFLLWNTERRQLSLPFASISSSSFDKISQQNSSLKVEKNSDPFWESAFKLEEAESVVSDVEDTVDMVWKETSS
jgi:hypothetical protein